MGTLLIERIGVAAENRIGRADVEISHRRQIATRPGKEGAHDELVFAIGRIREEARTQRRAGMFTAFEHPQIVAQAREAAFALRAKAKWPS